MSSQFKEARHVVILSVIVLVLAGCGGQSGPERATVRGKVTFDGQPVESGSVSLIPAAGTNGVTAGSTIVDGEYEIPRNGPTLGKYRVEIRAMRETGKQIESGPPSPPGTMVAEIAQFIPAKYNSNSELTVEIKSGENQHDFALTSK